MIDERRFRRDRAGEAAGRDANRLAAELGADPAHQPFNETDVSVEQPGLHRADRRPANRLRRLADVDTRQPRSTLEQRVGGNLNAWTDRAAEIFALCRDR